MSLPAKHFTWRPIDYVIDPPSHHVRVLRDHYWLTNDAGEVCFYLGRSPQCNTDRRTVEMFLGRTPGATGITHIPLALVPERAEAHR